MYEPSVFKSLILEQHWGSSICGAVSFLGKVMRYNIDNPDLYRIWLIWAFVLLAAIASVSTVRAVASSAKMSKVQVKSVVLDPRTSQPIVVLEDKKNGRILPIWIGPAEAQAIMMQLEGIQPPRPMTHDLIRNMIEGLKALSPILR